MSDEIGSVGKYKRIHNFDIIDTLLDGYFCGQFVVLFYVVDSDAVCTRICQKVVLDVYFGVVGRTKRDGNGCDKCECGISLENMDAIVE